MMCWKGIRQCRMLMLQLTAVTALCAAMGCSGDPAHSPYRPSNAATRDSVRANELAAEAVGMIEADPDRAEQLLRDALAVDIYHGPAHNNLGVIHLARGDLYGAAAEFEWARKLMPGHPDPRLNLAITLERAGRVDESLMTYRAALETHPHHIPTIQGLTRLELSMGRDGSASTEALREIAMRGESPRWRAWAREQLAQRSWGDPPEVATTGG